MTCVSGELKMVLSNATPSAEDAIPYPRSPLEQFIPVAEEVKEENYTVKFTHLQLMALQDALVLASRYKIETWDQTDSTWDQLDDDLYSNFKLQKIILEILYGE